MRKTYTKQEMFNKVYIHFIENKSPLSFNKKNGACSYRGEGTELAGGTVCAAGLLIDDQDYLPSMEGKHFWIFSSRFSYIKNEDVNFIGELQDAHDTAASRLFDDDDFDPYKFMANRLRNLAKKELLYVPGAVFLKYPIDLNLWKPGKFLTRISRRWRAS